MTEPLKPCPFCNSQELEHAAEPADARTYYGIISCCGCRLVVHSEECWWSETDAETDVKDRWNVRASQ